MRSALRPITLIVLASLVPSMALAYVVKRTATGNPVRWHTGSVTLHLSQGVVDHFGEDEARSAATIAADAWRGFGGPDLVIADDVDTSPYRPLAPGAQVIIEEVWPYAPALLAVTATSYQQATGEIIDADILINPTPPMRLLREGETEHAPDYDLAAVMTHESGHVLGLGESDADPLATMWPRIGRGDTHQRTLAEDDQAGLTEVYEGVVMDRTSSGCGAHVGVRPSGSFAWVLAGIAALVLAWAAWQRRNLIGEAARGTAARRAHPGLALAFVGAAVFAVVPSGQEPEDEPLTFRVSRALGAAARPMELRAAHLEAALTDEEPEVRHAALYSMARDLQRSDQDRAERFAHDPDPQIRDLAREVAEAARRAPPQQSVGLDEVEPARWQPFDGLVSLGRVVGTETRADAEGRHITEVRIESDQGTRTIDVPGGCHHGVCQQIGESTLPEIDETLMIAEDGRAWARVRDDLAYDGWLESDRAVRLR